MEFYSPQRRFLDSYLSSPILRNERDRLLIDILDLRSGVEAPKGAKRVQIIKTLADLHPSYDFLALEPENYAWITDRLDHLPAMDDLEATLVSVQKTVRHTDSGLKEWGVLLNTPISSFITRVNLNPLQENYKRMVFFETYINALGRSRASGSRATVTTGGQGYDMVGNEYVVAFVDHTEEVIMLLAYQQCLMLKDLFYGRFNAHLAVQLLYPGEDGSAVLSRCFTWAFACLTDYGNAGYELVKCIEALAKTNITRKAGGPFAVDGPHEKMMLEVESKERKLSGGETPHTANLDSILKESRSLELDIELFGLQKLSGHPLVDPYEGGKKVRETSRKRVKYRPSDLKRLRNNFCRMYLEGYVRKNSSWPAMSALPGAIDTRLYQLMMLNELKINVRSYPLEDWEFFRFKKHHEFDYYVNFLDLMDDKSISFYRDQFMTTWDKTIKPRSNKRLLIEMLSRKTINIRSIVDQVRVGNIPFSWLIVSLYPKEREFKMEPRMFGMMVFEMRAFFTCVEANVADKVFPNLPPQTMTLSKIEIQELFQEVTTDQRGQGGMRLYEEFDLSGWNGHFHDEVCDPISMDLEDMFGVPGAFSVIHHFFKKCIMVVRVSECPPPNGYLAQSEGAFGREHESSVLWPDHDAGIEGLAQKNWTCPTYSMFDLAMQRFGIKYYLIGQADNQTCTAWVPDSLIAQYPGGIKELATAMAESADQECRKAGHELNLDECLHSTEVITYSKDVYVRGVEYYTSVKALSRVFPHSASDFPSVVNSIGAIAGQCLAAAERCKNPLIAYWISLFHSALYLSTLSKRRPVETLYLPKETVKSLTPGMISCLLEYPGEMGGLPIGHILGFLYKGGGDPLSKACGSSKIQSYASRELRRVMFMLNSGKWFDKDPSRERLLDDPYSLPLMSVRTPEMAILSDSIDRVKGLAKNDNIFEMISLTTGVYETSLRSRLASAKPFHPVLMADILGLSLVGLVRTALKMFTSTQTIQSLLQGDEVLNPCQRILASGSSQFSGLILRMTRVDGSEHTIQSAYEFTEHLRSYWNTDKENPLVGLSVVTPADLSVSYVDPSSTVQGFKLEVDNVSERDLKYTRGKYKVYFGRATQEHRSEHGYRIITSSAPDVAIAQLLRIATQPGVGEGLISALEHVIDTRGNLGLKETLPFTGKVYGGMISHRYQSRLGHLAANILGFAAQASHVCLNTDTAAPISGGEEDYSVMVQECMVALIGIASVSWPFPNSSSSLTLRTDQRVWVPLSEEEIVLPWSPIEVKVEMKENPMVYSPVVELERSVTRNILPMIRLMPIRGDDKKIPYGACTRKIWRQMNRSHIASAVADRGAGKIHLDLDIAEVTKLGADVIVHLASLAVAQFSIDALFSRSEGEFRWTPMPVIMSLARAISESLAVYVRHPMVQRNLMRQSGLLETGLSYKERRTHLSAKIGRRVVAEALSMFNNPSSILYEAPILLFYDDPEGESWRTLAHAYKRACLQSVAIGEIPLTVAYTLVRRNLTAAVMGKSTEVGRATRMANLVSTTLDWAKTEALPQLAHSLSYLSDGKTVLMVQCALGEALRLARQLTPRKPPDIEEDVTETLDEPDICYTLLGQQRVHAPAPIGSNPWSSTFDLMAYDLWTIRRLAGRAYGLESSVGYSYLPILQAVRGSPFVAVGCGQAAGGALLLLAGATMCYGLDLKADITPEARMTGQYTPLHIKRLGLQQKFLRLGWGGGWEGDIADSRCIPLLRSAMSSGQLWILDIPIHTLLTVQKTLWNISVIDPTATVLVRMLGLTTKILEVAEFLTSLSKEVFWYPVFCEDVFKEGWLKCTLTSGRVTESKEILNLPGQGTPYPSTGVITMLGGGRDYLMEICTSGLTSCSQAEIETGMDQLFQMIAAASGELDHRFTYNQWTDVVAALISLQITQSQDPLNLISEILSHDTVTITLGDRVIPKAVDMGLRRLMTRVLSRCL